MRYTADFHYFDNIDTPEKAYWLGFIWADGYIVKRNRQYSENSNRVEYNLKLAIKDIDAGHIQKFLDSIESNYPVHIYKTTGFDRSQPAMEARAFITNKYMCSLLYESYGIIPRRSDPSKIIANLPKHLERYFILGTFDADGSFTAYQGDYGEKLNVNFGGSVELLRFIESHLEYNHVIQRAETPSGKRRVAIRHEGKDGTWRSLRFAGKPQGMKILRYLYDDSPIYLERKYQKYLSIPYHQ